MKRVIQHLLALAVFCSPAYAQAPAPSPSPCTKSALQCANGAGFSVDSQVGAMTVTTSDTGTGLTPTISVDAEGPLVFGSGSVGRIGARLVLTGEPGQAIDGTDPTNYKGVETDLRACRVVGVSGDVRTALCAEYGFTTLIKGSTQARPRNGLVRSFGVGLSFASASGSAQLTIEGGFDEATTSCSLPVVCTGIHSGFAAMIYGQVPILDGKVLFGGDVSIAVAPAFTTVQRTSVERVFVTVDPVKALKGKAPADAPPPAAASNRSPALAQHAAGFVGP